MLNSNTNNIIPINMVIYILGGIYMLSLAHSILQWRDKRTRKYAHFQQNTSTDRLIAIFLVLLEVLGNGNDKQLKSDF